MGGALFLQLTLAEIGHYSKPRAGWETVIERFPSTVSEIEEASKCFALGRYTACVFHLMRALEPGLRALSDKLKIRKRSANWHAFLSAMPARIDRAFSRKSRASRAKHDYYSGLASQLGFIKTAWRNPTMHNPEKIYTEEMARELIVLVRGYMREASKHLRESQRNNAST